jgi:hypothetical protein
MDNVVALVVLIGLLAALLVAWRVAKVRQNKRLEERERARRKQPKYKPRPMSHRGEMRAYDDPSTLAGEITTRGTSPTTTQNPSGGAATNSPVTDRPGMYAKPEAHSGTTRRTGKRSRARGKGRA